jgi:hypothetical protein
MVNVHLTEGETDSLHADATHRKRTSKEDFRSPSGIAQWAADSSVLPRVRVDTEACRTTNKHLGGLARGAATPVVVSGYECLCLAQTLKKWCWQRLKNLHVRSKTRIHAKLVPAASLFDAHHAKARKLLKPDAAQEAC